MSSPQIRLLRQRTWPKSEYCFICYRFRQPRTSMDWQILHDQAAKVFGLSAEAGGAIADEICAPVPHRHLVLTIPRLIRPSAAEAGPVA
jgi:hypothetical protein